MLNRILKTLKQRQQDRSKSRVVRGMTLLEIMIVLAIIALVMGLFVGPRIIDAFSEAEEETQWMTAKQFASQAYGRWRAKNPGSRCPENLAALTKYMNQTDIKDYQSKDGKDLYVMYCGDKAQNIPGGFGVAHVGKDGQADTKDDIKSWEKKPQ